MRKYLLILSIASVMQELAAQTVDSIAFRQVDSLINISSELTKKKEYEKALVIITSAKNLAEQKLGKKSAAYGSCCHNLGNIAVAKNDISQAKKWFLTAITIRKTALGKVHPDVATSLIGLARIYEDEGDFDKAEPLYLEAKSIRERVLGTEHPDYASILIDLGLFYKAFGDFTQAESYLVKAKNYREKIFGKDHQEYSKSLNNLASLKFALGDYSTAESLFLETKFIIEKVAGKEGPDYERALNNLAVVYTTMGNFEKTKPLILEAVSLSEKMNGKKNEGYLTTFLNLTSFYIRIGDFSKAEPLCLEAKNIIREVLGEVHPLYAGCLNNLATVYQKLGNYEKAEAHNLEAIRLTEVLFGKKHSNYANRLMNLASLYRTLGKYSNAEPLLIEASRILKEVYGKDHPDYSMSLNNLGNLYGEMGNFEKAEALLLRSKKIDEKYYGEEHYYVASSINNLAILYEDMGDIKKAETLYLQAKALYEKSLGKENSSYVESLQNLANFYEKNKRFAVSGHFQLELFKLEQEALTKSTSFLSEKEIAQYTSIFQNNEDQLGFSLYRRWSNHEPIDILPALTYDRILFKKGFLLVAAQRLNNLASTTPETRAIRDMLRVYRHSLFEEYAKPIAERKNTIELEEKANTMEKELSQSVANYADGQRQVSWQEVRNALKSDEAAIEFVQYKNAEGKTTDSILYAALLLKPEDVQPQFIPLFEEKQLTNLLSKRKESGLVSQLYASRGVTPIEEPVVEGLRQFIWDPLDHALVGVKTVYYSPFGLLHRLNLDAIPDHDELCIGDTYQLIRLGSTRNLVVSNAAAKYLNNDAVLYGGIMYTKDSSLYESVHSATSLELRYLREDSTVRGGTWNYLPGTEREVNSIEKFMQTAGISVDLKKGYQATEASFKNIGANSSPSPRILHIATHGYFFPDPKESHQSSVISRQEEPVFKISEHPMLRSGLIMAGGNAVWQGQQTLEGKEDGILTAYEISQMNLSNTELVVLSACETGLGDIQGNEGVYGLQRAFKIAGAKYLIMSLWQVPDKQTSLLMTTFYKKWLEEKMTIPNAFHAAQKELRDIGLDPYQWAGFVLVE